MTETQLDSVYTQLCNTMTELGEANSPLFLARFAMLAIDSIGDAQAVQRLIADARDGMAGAECRAGSRALSGGLDAIR